MEVVFSGAEEPEWLEESVTADLKVWQIIFLVFGVILAFTIGICCCIRFRVPRTKQQIEADYQRRIITKKFRQQLERIQNSQMDSLDLQAALEIVRADFRKDMPDSDKDEKAQNVSLISSLASNDQGSDGDSIKSSKQLNEQITNGQGSNPNRGGFGSRLIALVRLSKQQKPQDVIC